MIKLTELYLWGEQNEHADKLLEGCMVRLQLAPTQPCNIKDRVKSVRRNLDGNSVTVIFKETNDDFYYLQGYFCNSISAHARNRRWFSVLTQAY